MTIDEILNALRETQNKLNQAGVDDIPKMELEILLLQLERQLMLGAFDTLKDITTVTVVDTTKLRSLTEQLGKDIANEQKRTQTVTRIIGIAKSALRGAGMPIP